MSVLIGLNIKKIRQVQNITQKELADFLGVANTTVSSWEIGRTEPDMDTVKRISAYLNCGLVDIVGSTEQNTFYLTEEEKELIRRFRLSPHKDAILSLLGIEKST